MYAKTVMSTTVLAAVAAICLAVSTPSYAVTACNSGMKAVSHEMDKANATPGLDLFDAGDHFQAAKDAMTAGHEQTCVKELNNTLAAIAEAKDRSNVVTRPDVPRSQHTTR